MVSSLSKLKSTSLVTPSASEVHPPDANVAYFHSVDEKGKSFIQKFNIPKISLPDNTKNDFDTYRSAVLAAPSISGVEGFSAGDRYRTQGGTIEVTGDIEKLYAEMQEVKKAKGGVCVFTKSATTDGGPMSLPAEIVTTGPDRKGIGDFLSYPYLFMSGNPRPELNCSSDPAAKMPAAIPKPGAAP